MTFEDLGRIVVIIPTYNRADTLRLCLRAFDRQETEAPFEIVVCDSDDVDVFTSLGDNLLFFHCPTDGGKTITQPRSGFELELGRGARHL